MRITLLGTGSAIPTGDRYQTGLVVEPAEGAEPLLIDCGAGTIHRLVHAGYDLTEFGTLLLTHHHLDHVADIPSLLKARLMLDAPEAVIVGPPGTEDYLSSLLTVDRVADRTALRVREPDQSSFSVAGRDVETCETEHSEPGFAYRIDDLFAFSGDTAAAERIAEFADGAAVLVHDCAHLDETRSNHATPEALGRTLADADIGALYLTHLYPDAAANAERMRRTVREYVDADVRVAQDLEPIEIPERG